MSEDESVRTGLGLRGTDQARVRWPVACRVIKDAWVELGEPLNTRGSTGQLIAHPLLKAMNEADLFADRLRQRVVAKTLGA